MTGLHLIKYSIRGCLEANAWLNLAHLSFLLKAHGTEYTLPAWVGYLPQPPGRESLSSNIYRVKKVLDAFFFFFNKKNEQKSDQGANWS